MGKSAYIHTVSEVFGVGDSAVYNIVLEVYKLMIEVTWDVAFHFHATERNYINLNDFRDTVAVPILLWSNRWMPRSNQMTARRRRVSQRIS